MKFYYQWRSNFSLEGENSVHIIRHQKKHVKWKNNFEVGPTDWGRALRRLIAINDELALTLTTEPVYKNIFLPGEGAQLPPSPRPFPRIPPPYC